VRAVRAAVEHLDTDAGELFRLEAQLIRLTVQSSISPITNTFLYLVLNHSLGNLKPKD
jgi:hypothetical protein